VVTVDQLSEILTESGTRAGEYKLFDPVAIRVVGRSKIPTVIFNGKDPQNLRQVMKGMRSIGTRIVH
ncbi:MAG: UMP kinase, partial [Candidatus Thorarchaeota archaeon]